MSIRVPAQSLTQLDVRGTRRERAPEFKLEYRVIVALIFGIGFWLFWLPKPTGVCFVLDSHSALLMFHVFL